MKRENAMLKQHMSNKGELWAGCEARVSKRQARARRHLGSKVAVRYGSKEAVKRQHASATQGEL